jgi:excisionase family DNA binding protein
VEKILVTVEEATHILSMGRTRIYQLIRSGELKSVKCGKSRRIVADSIRTYVDTAAN